MRKVATLGTALLIGGALVAGAAPAQAQELDCATQLQTVCEPVNRQLAHVNEELGYAMETLYRLYDNVDRTVRCVVFKDCV